MNVPAVAGVSDAGSEEAWFHARDVAFHVMLPAGL